MRRTLGFGLFACTFALLSSACSGGGTNSEELYIMGDGDAVPAAGGSATTTTTTGATTGAGGSSNTGGTGASTSSGGAASGGGNLGSGGIVTGGGGSSAGGTAGNSGGGSGGDAGGSGGAGPLPTKYAFGFAPATVSVADARAAYDAWKDVHLEDCGGGVHRVRWENAKLDATVSEGIGYGMLLAVGWGDQAVFDGLYAYYNKALNQGTPGGQFTAAEPATGLMHWLRYGCSAERKLDYNATPDGAAADADLDVAMSLIMADCKWGGGNYSSEATKVIANIRQHMFTNIDGLEVLQPGDSSWFDSDGMRTGCINYSYFAPAYYREFAKYESSEASFWNKAASDSYPLLSKASESNTGLVRNWGAADGGNPYADCDGAYNRAGSYGDDAARTPWRVATDYLWNGETSAKAWNDKVTTWVNGIGIANTIQWYHLDGSQDTEAGGYADHTVINVGPWAVGAMTYDQVSADAFAAEVIAIPSGPSDHDGEYFQRMLKALSLLTLTGGFNVCGGDN